MSSDFHKVTALITRDSEGGKVNRIMIDGREVKGWTDYSISHYAPGLARVTIEFYATIETGTAVIDTVQDDH